MECPKCGGTNVTSTGLGTKVWKCMREACGKEFNRDTAYVWSTGRKLNGASAR